ncbi:hypothetical protein P3T73_00030 [Kiritimatiellota bacterium B12222]|nr:hypothetical protein P3T73_00030 [Kiritimatiellota bacterium B12222]
MRFESEELFQFSARHHTDDELFSSFHVNELVDKRREETVLHIDHLHRGSGNGSCGPQTLTEYCVEPGHYEFDYWIDIR